MNFQDAKLRRFKQVDVFTAIPGYGNALAVVVDADGLSAQDMQRLARWTNLSETAFIFEDEKADYHVRIFSPDRELPFAGHPAIGTAHAAIEAGVVDGSRPFQMRCGLGLLTHRTDGQKVWVRVPPPALLDLVIDTGQLAEALNGLSPINPLVFDTGPIWMVSRVASVDELIESRINREKLISLSHQTSNAVGIILYALNQEKGIEVRAFAPAAGVDEDPVCGSGNIAAAGHLKETGNLSRTGTDYMARQGRHLGRDGILYLSVGDEYFELGGEAVTVVDGKIML